ncbi:S9 family peptidase [Pacificimonas sp. WHA3]|uniref:S9 family peptidase n=1 Tax=Pacificimonas pallii TaxID=2827236 RepID=A0ABS6SGX3_9SPHN|nr:alpha/beta fold hydrolase [Pacificimonas pallii]MBV7257678.1 S9 family peptidase [Pacificimonas pallii]
MVKSLLMAALGAAALSLGPAAAQDFSDTAIKFGRMPDVTNMRLAPDGKHVSYLDRSGPFSVLYVANVASGEKRPVLRSDKNVDFHNCRWLNVERLACLADGQSDEYGKLIGFTRMLAFSLDGSDVVQLGQRNRFRSVGMNQYSGNIIDILPDEPRHVLMEIELLPERTGSTLLADTRKGLSVQKVDIYSGRMRTALSPTQNAARFGTDGRGNVRVILQRQSAPRGNIGNTYRYLVSEADKKNWVTFAEAQYDDPAGVSFEGFDETGQFIYMLRPHKGRQALFKEPASGKGTPELVFAHDAVDVDGLVKFGRWGRPVGVSWSDEYPHIEFFDPELEQLTDALTGALGGDVSVQLLEDSWDGNRILLNASSDRDPGTYYIFDQETKQLIKMSAVRLALSDTAMSEVTPISYPAADGTQIPGYLTLPPGTAADARNLPFIVLPHGGPSARDTWGFDWLAQSLAANGYAVLQPNYRGSAGFGATWLGDNAFRAWRTSIDDINDGARWAARSGLADAGKMAILGWSYGGYAALQAATVDPGLYKAVVAIAPVADLGQLKEDSRGFTNYRIVAAQVGSGPHIEEGSPKRRAALFQAPVLLFHGDKDLNVDVGHSRAMEDALQDAGKPVTYIEYEDLDHGLPSSFARTDMLTRTERFLSDALR